MITEKQVDDIVQGKLTKLSVSSLPCWINKTRTEGLQLSNGILTSFWVRGSEKVFGQTASQDIQQIIDSIKSEKSENKDIQTTCVDDAILPETFSPPLIEKWQKMKTIDRMLLFQKTPKDKILDRPGASGKTVKYVTGNYMLREANAAFLFDWDFEISGMSIGSEGVSVWGIITVNVDGKVIKRACVGYEDVNKYMNQQLAIKSAATDCIKKGLSLFGFNSDVYSGEV